MASIQISSTDFGLYYHEALNDKFLMRTKNVEEKKSWGVCLHLLLLYDASKLSTVYVVKPPVLDLQWGFFQKS